MSLGILIFSYINLYGCHVTWTNWWLSHYKIRLFIFRIAYAQNSSWSAINMATTALLYYTIMLYLFNHFYLTHLYAFVTNKNLSNVCIVGSWYFKVLYFKNPFQVFIVSDTFRSLWTNTSEGQGGIIPSDGFREFGA